jgi:hypothetical protein
VNDGLALSFSSFEMKLSEHLAASATFFSVKPRTMRACLSRAPIRTSFGTPVSILRDRSFRLVRDDTFIIV